MDINFRPCGISDLQQLQELSTTTFSDAFASQNSPSDFQTYLQKAFSLEQLHRELANPNTSFFLVENKTNIVGYLKVNFGDAQTDLKEELGMELERIYVLSSYQGKGLGHQMLQFAEELAITSRKTYLWLGVWEHNTKAIRFYERHGYRKFGTHPYCIGTDKQTDWLLKKEFL